MSTRNRTSIETYSGLFYDYLDPKPEQIRLQDVAHALSHSCRYRGHCYRYYSVAEHAVRVSKLVAKLGDKEMALHALHHDDHEAYLGDVVTPLKRILGDKFEEMADACDIAICEKFDLDPFLLKHDIVAAADYNAMLYEAYTLKPSRGAGVQWGNDEPLPPPDDWGVIGWPCGRAYLAYLDAHETLSS